MIPIAATESVIDQIVASRDYYSHRIQTKRAESAHGFLLKRYAYFLRALYTLELLVLLGLHPAEVLGLVGGNYELNESLNLRAFPMA